MLEPLHESEIEWDTWYEGTPREIRGKALSDSVAKAQVGVGLLELPPGSDTRPAHYRSHEEEHLFVLSGRVLLHLGDQKYELRPGSYVRFPAGIPMLHHLQNPYDTPCRYLMVGQRDSEDVVTHEQPAT